MENVVTVERMRDLDRHLIEKAKIPGIVLMENAASFVAEAVIKADKKGLHVIMIGPGNNGGDGLAVLRKLICAGKNAIGLIMADEACFKNDALINLTIAKELELPLTKDESVLDRAELIVDAIFGTGLTRNIEERERRVIERANSIDAYRIAVDIPTGINGNTGEVMGCCFSAHETITFLAVKRGMLLTKNLESLGKMTVASIAIPKKSETTSLETEQLLDAEFVSSLLPDRKRISNKGDYGRSLIIAGSIGMPGAALMAAKACLFAGSGLTKVHTPREIEHEFSALPEVMRESDTDSALKWADAVGIGCGMGNDAEKRIKLEKTLRSGKKTVIDADALNSLDDELKKLLSNAHIVTPHPGEMSRLCGKSVEQILADPVNTALDFSKEYGCITVLKNAVSIIAEPGGRIRYNSCGSPALAKGGSGDCLTGIMTALLAQGLSPFDAASAGCFLLGTCANEALTLLNTRSVSASSVMEMLKSDILI